MNLILLIIIAPAQLKDELLELLGEHPDLASGFTVSQAEGHGPDLAFQTLTDQVRGRVDRIRVECVIESANVSALRGEIKQKLSGSNIVCWTVPVMEFGKC
jgi:hypothetical protein